MDESKKSALLFEPDPLVRDGKKLPNSGCCPILFTFLITLFLVAPLWLFLLLPLTLITQLIMLPFKCCCKSKAPEVETISVPEPASDEYPTQDRTYDLVVFGATGFTGKFVAKHIAKEYGDTIKWAIVGRRRQALETVRSELTAINENMKDLPILIADSFKPETLKAVVVDTRVVVTTVGPFASYGTPLVRMCAQYGTHYCDTTGETDWVRRMIDLFDDLARKTGARIVHFCANDCIPWDILTQQMAQKMKESGDSLEEISIYDEINSGISGGTLNTIFYSLANRVKYPSSLGFDPLMKTIDGTKSNCKTKMILRSSLGYSGEHGSWVGAFLMAMVMANCVRRSNAVNQYGNNLIYKEAMVFPGFMAGFTSTITLLVFGTALYFPPLKALIKCLLPPGSGPSEKSMDDMFLKLVAYGKGKQGTNMKGMIYIPDDPGYRYTAKMCAESGLALALQLDEITTGGGVWTPAACLGNVILARLQRIGTELQIS